MTVADASARPALRPWYVVVFCLLIASVVGGALTSLGFTGLMWVVDSSGMSIGYRAVLVLAIAFAIATPLCLLGLVVFGAPVWLGLRLLGRDSPGACVMAGGVASLAFGLIYLALNKLPSFPELSLATLAFIPLFGLPGAACGWIMRRFAYRGIRASASHSL